MNSIDNAVEIEFYIPAMPDQKSHHVISRGQYPNFYRPEDLRDKGMGKTLWVDAFEKMFVGLYCALGGPVPYAFRTPDNKIRSLDAGCIRMLLNRKPPEVLLNCVAHGFISSLMPSEVMLERYQVMRAILEKRVRDAGSEDG